MLFILVVLIGFNLFKGTESNPSRWVSYCSIYYWLTTLGQFLFSLVMVITLSVVIRKKYAEKIELKIKPAPGDFEMTPA